MYFDENYEEKKKRFILKIRGEKSDQKKNLVFRKYVAAILFIIFHPFLRGYLDIFYFSNNTFCSLNALENNTFFEMIDIPL